jgi:alkylhydroperoxidase/carboxymuconolactone decarboxylase family protein YurZ
MSDEAWERGMQIRREVLGDAHVDAAIERTTDFTADFQEYITCSIWAGVWGDLARPPHAQRRHADRAGRARAEGELRCTCVAALRNGLTVAEIKEILLQTAAYCARPRPTALFAIAQAVLAEEGREASRCCSAVRTPIGRYGGALATVRPDDLAAIAISAAVERAGIDAAEIEDVYLGCANQAGEDNRNVARMGALLAGLPPSVAGVTLNRLCASGLAAIAPLATQCSRAMATSSSPAGSSR